MTPNYENTKQGARYQWDASGLRVFANTESEVGAPNIEIPWAKIDEMRAQFVPVDTGKPATGLVEFLHSTSDQFRDAPREGAFVDEPEGSRYVQISDKAANHLAVQLKLMAQLADPFSLPDILFRAYANQVAAEVRRRMAKAAPLVQL